MRPEFRLISDVEAAVRETGMVRMDGTPEREKYAEAFLQGAKWHLWITTGFTMRQSEQEAAYMEGLSRFAREEAAKEEKKKP